MVPVRNTTSGILKIWAAEWLSNHVKEENISKDEEEIFGETHIVFSCVVRILLWFIIFKFINCDMNDWGTGKELSLLLLSMLRWESECLSIAHRIFPHGISKPLFSLFCILSPHPPSEFCIDQKWLKTSVKHFMCTLMTKTVKLVVEHCGVVQCSLNLGYTTMFSIWLQLLIP